MPDIHTAAVSAAPAGSRPAPHPMDPRRGDAISPAFAAYLCWLLDLEPLTEPAVTGAAVSGGVRVRRDHRRPVPRRAAGRVVRRRGEPSRLGRGVRR